MMRNTGLHNIYSQLLTIIFVIAAGAVSAQADTTKTEPLGKKRGGAIAVKPDSTVVIRIDSLIADTTVIAQTPDSAGTTRKPFFITRFFKKDYPNPKKALYMSLILPGSGQAYNRKWWKIPIVYGTLGGLTWLEINNVNAFKTLKYNYKALVDDDPLTIVDEQFAGRDAQTMKSARDIARKNLEQSSLLLGLGYLLSVSDAFVDAHLATFDVSEDLSLKICPKSIPTPAFGPAFGVGLAISYKR